MKIMEKDSKAKVTVVNAKVKEALRRETMRVDVIDFVTRPFHVADRLKPARLQQRGKEIAI